MTLKLSARISVRRRGDTHECRQVTHGSFRLYSDRRGTGRFRGRLVAASTQLRTVQALPDDIQPGASLAGNDSSEASSTMSCFCGVFALSVTAVVPPHPLHARYKRALPARAEVSLVRQVNRKLTTIIAVPSAAHNIRALRSSSQSSSFVAVAFSILSDNRPISTYTDYDGRPVQFPHDSMMRDTAWTLDLGALLERIVGR